MPDEQNARLLEISERLEVAARHLRSDDLDPDDASRIAGECAELAQQAAGELDRLARSSPQEGVPGQEELL